MPERSYQEEILAEQILRSDGRRGKQLSNLYIFKSSVTDPDQGILVAAEQGNDQESVGRL